MLRILCYSGLLLCSSSATSSHTSQEEERPNKMLWKPKTVLLDGRIYMETHIFIQTFLVVEPNHH
jgi:hypothetical protein